MGKIKHKLEENRIVIEVPETATSQEIQEYEEQLHKYVVEAAHLPLNYVMIDSGQQIY